MHCYHFQVHFYLSASLIQHNTVCQDAVLLEISFLIINANKHLIFNVESLTQHAIHIFKALISQLGSQHPAFIGINCLYFNHHMVII